MSNAPQTQNPSQSQQAQPGKYSSPNIADQKQDDTAGKAGSKAPASAQSPADSTKAAKNSMKNEGGSCSSSDNKAKQDGCN